VCVPGLDRFRDLAGLRMVSKPVVYPIPPSGKEERGGGGGERSPLFLGDGMPPRLCRHSQTHTHAPKSSPTKARDTRGSQPTSSDRMPSPPSLHLMTQAGSLSPSAQKRRQCGSSLRRSAWWPWRAPPRPSWSPSAAAFLSADQHQPPRGRCVLLLMVEYPSPHASPPTHPPTHPST
jgi:hypothetical protein